MYYTSNLTNEQWAIIEPMLTKNEGKGRPIEVDMREVFNGINYLLKTGAQWRNLPMNFPKYQTVYYHFKKFKKSGLWRDINDRLVEKIREKAGRNKTPTASIIDSQTVKTTAYAKKEEVGFDCAKKTKGKKRHIAVDVLGLILSIVITSAGIADHKAAPSFFGKLFKKFPSIKLIWADSGYHKTSLINDVKNIWGKILEIVKRPRGTVGFKVLQWRWIVERTFGWLSNFRRLSKDYERIGDTTIAWMYLAMINIMTARMI